MTQSSTRIGLVGVTFDAATKELLLGPPTVFTAENAGNFNY